mgnify:CR=1 FL=1
MDVFRPIIDVFGRLSEEDYDAFYESVCEAAVIARNAYEAETVQESADLWRKLYSSHLQNVPEDSF